METQEVVADQPQPGAATLYWRPMRSCTPGREVQLLNPGLRPVYGRWDGKDPQWLGWAPMPEMPPQGLAA